MILEKPGTALRESEVAPLLKLGSKIHVLPALIAGGVPLTTSAEGFRR